MNPKLATVKRLFALSGNRCAFPDCDTPIVEASNTMTGVICHIHAHNPGGPRYDPMQSDKDRHAFENLILLCARHSNWIDKEPDTYPAPLLRQWKIVHEEGRVPKLSPNDSKAAELLLRPYRVLNISGGGHVMLNSPGAVLGSTVVIKTQTKSVRIGPPAGCIASDLPKRNYVKHLIDRYNEFAQQQRDRAFRYQAVYGSIQRQFGAKWDMVPLERFQDLSTFVQRKIDSTKLGRINRAKGNRNYSKYDDFRLKYGIQEHPREI